MDIYDATPKLSSKMGQRGGGAFALLQTHNSRKCVYFNVIVLVYTLGVLAK